jgi:hypothetical protein
LQYPAIHLIVAGEAQAAKLLAASEELLRRQNIPLNCLDKLQVLK